MTLWNFYFQIFNKAIGKEEVVEFLSHLLQHLAGPLLILWDRLPAHRSYLATRSPSYRASGYIRTALQWEMHTAVATWAIKTLVMQVPEPEIYYPAGVELTLTLTEPVVLVAPKKPSEGLSRLAGDERMRMQRLIVAIPYQTYAPVSKRPSDPVNVVFIAPRDQLGAAFIAAGWTQARPVSFRTGLQGIRAVAETKGDRAAPMSPLLLNDAEPDMSWQKGFNDVSKRHHIRLWRQSGTWDGEEVWIGAATRDVNFAYLRPGHAFTHRIEENVDSERDKVVHEILYSLLA